MPIWDTYLYSNFLFAFFSFESNEQRNAVSWKKICEKNIKYIWYCTPREVFIGTLFIGFANTIENWF